MVGPGVLVHHSDLVGVDVGVLPDEEEEDLQPVGVQVDGPEEQGAATRLPPRAVQAKGAFLKTHGTCTR